MKEMKVSVSSW